MVRTINRVVLLGTVCTGIALGFNDVRKTPSSSSISSLGGQRWIDRIHHPYGRGDTDTYVLRAIRPGGGSTHRDRLRLRLHATVGGPLADDLVAGASQKLLWETLDESSQRPVLDLSSRQNDATFKDISRPRDGDENGADTSEWDQGQRWNVTKQSLSAMGIDVVGGTESIFLRECPQLLRLESSTVVEMAQWVIDEFGVNYLQSSPTLLGFRAADAIYGLEFLSLMMMVPDAKPSCVASGKLLLAAIQGGIQERAVKNALGSASTAASQASQAIAADAVASYRQLKTANKNPKRNTSS
jgi:hypothetical protein